MTTSVVLLPGLLCDQTVWAAQRAALPEAVDVIVPDYSRLDSIHAMARSVLSEVGAPRFCLAGHSMGGRVALEIVRLAPERIERLMLLDTGYQALVEGDMGKREREGRMALLRKAQQEGMREMGAQWAQGMVHPSKLDTALFDNIIDMIERSDVDQFAAQINALLSRPDASQTLAAIRCPTTIVCGRQDLWSPLARHEVMQAAIAGSRLAIIEDSGHMSTMEQPAAVCDVFLAWMDIAKNARSAHI